MQRDDSGQNSSESTNSDGPVQLVEDIETGNRFLIYHAKQGSKVELQVEGSTFWTTQQQMADAFGVTRQNVAMHLQNIFAEGELFESAVCKESLHTARDGKRYPTKRYDLNALISVGYRVGGPLGTAFRIWATDKLLRFMTQGFVIDSDRLKDPSAYDRVAELRKIILDIRAAESNVYAELRRICSMCQDYDPTSDRAHRFYGHMQAKLFWAVTNSTPSMVLHERADARAEHMGLKTWPKADIRQSDALVAKNYLSELEIKELNRLTTILLDIFDDQLDIGKLTRMAEAEALLDAQLKNLNRSVLKHGGSISHSAAEVHVKKEYKKFDGQRRQERAAQTAKELASLKATAKRLPRTKKGNPQS